MYVHDMDDFFRMSMYKHCFNSTLKTMTTSDITRSSWIWKLLMRILLKCIISTWKTAVVFLNRLNLQKFAINALPNPSNML